MPHSYSNLWFHLVFGTKERRPLIAESWRPRVHEYPGGIVRGLEAAALQIGGVEDHVHLLVRLKPVHRIDYFLRDIKADSFGVDSQAALVGRVFLAARVRCVHRERIAD